MTKLEISPLSRPIYKEQEQTNGGNKMTLTEREELAYEAFINMKDGHSDVPFSIRQFYTAREMEWVKNKNCLRSVLEYNLDHKLDEEQWQHVEDVRAGKFDIEEEEQEYKELVHSNDFGEVVAGLFGFVIFLVVGGTLLKLAYKIFMFAWQ